MQESKVIYDGGSKTTGAQGMNLRDVLDLSDSSDIFLGFKVAQGCDLKSPWIQGTRAMVQVVIPV